ncbi:DUF4167 domain-containing protein [Bartonella vinsonii]|uniref:DUF4167 domain-containing protein n=1 Tax=Bartonella vinsonii subsp. berkhoffii str. Tweed TaxID=1094502 RepID=N6UW23_BARVB|nr:DUF4167 domain-containing protein [Bartonella vinsonii]AGF76344.1 hypothetical protein BVwin_12630 [Bartonella vinsonii subsp. berkhoffii str. Winnie]ENN94278.1 hypothetical protein BVtw_13600 [Bartonella vinsonii subsp. berkhoffii str. Tweed]
MRPQQNRRVRGRNNNNNGNSNNNNNNRRGPNPLSRNYESSGPDVKIRGNAQQIADKYISLARDAQGAGDRVMSENYLQHAEHYLRIILAAVGQNSQSARRDESRDENNEQEYGEINTEGERKDTVSCDTDAFQTTDMSQIRAQENGCGQQHTRAQNGCAQGDTLEAPALLDEESDQEQCVAEESIEPVKKNRRSSRRRTVRSQEKASLELPGFEISKTALETSQNGDASTEKTTSFPVLGEEIQKKPRRRRVATSSVEENV